MRKLLQTVLPLILLIVLLVAGVAACEQKTEPTTEDDPYLRLAATSTTQFYLGEVDLSVIRIEVYDPVSATVTESVVLDQSMLSESDYQKLDNIGTHTVAVVYNDLTYNLTVTVMERPVQHTYTWTFYATRGAFENGSTTFTHSGTTISTLPVPALSGYRFVGWFNNEQLTGQQLVVDGETAMTSDQSFYAKWQDNRQYKVDFRDGVTGGIFHTVTGVEHGTDVTLPTPPSKKEYRFVGWSSDGKNITKDTVIEAQYEVLEYTVTYKYIDPTSGDWTSVVKGPVRWGQSLPASEQLELPARNGYTAQWVDDETLKAPELSSITRNISITAQYTPIVHIVRYLDRNEAVVSTQLVSHGETVPQVLDVPSVPGHTGVWRYYTASGALEPIDLSVFKIERDIDIYATYTKNRYKVTYVWGGSTQEDTVDYGTVLNTMYDLFALPDSPYDPKYDEVNWYTSSSYDEQHLVKLPYYVERDVTFYARISKKPLFVDFLLPDRAIVKGTVAEPISYESVTLPIEGYDSTDPYILRREGITGGIVAAPALNLGRYKVEGWQMRDGTRVDLNTISDFHEYSDNPEEDTALYAILVVKRFTVRFYNMTIEGNADNVRIVFSELESERMDNVLHGAEIVPLSSDRLTPPSYPWDPDAASFRFEAWYPDRNLIGEAYNPAGVVVESNLSFYAKWFDEAKGSEGLQYRAIYGADETIEAYEVVGFKPNVPNGTVIEQVIVPRMHEGKPVVTITRSAFNSNFNVKIKSIQLTEVITTIEEGAFMFNTALLDFGVMDGIDRFAFEDGILYRVDESGRKTLILAAAPAALGDTVEIAAEVERIGEGAFAACKSLTAVRFAAEGKLSEIGAHAFDGCDRLSAIALPASLTTIEEGAFRSCLALQTITLDPATRLTLIGEGALDDTLWYMNAAQNTDRVELGNVLIRYFADVERLELPASITVIAPHAFAKEAAQPAFKLQQLIISQGSQLQVIGAEAFASCPDLVLISINITDRVVQIDPDAFVGLGYTLKLSVPSALRSEYVAMLQGTNIDIVGI